MLDILGTQAFGVDLRPWEWWEVTLVAILGASGLLGIIALLCFSGHSVSRLLNIQDNERILPRSTRERIRFLSCETNVVRRNRAFSAEPSSFGVYLGALNTPITEEEAKVLSQWDAVVLDYRASGVLEAVCNESVHLGPCVIARLDLRHLSHFATVNENSSLEIVNLIFETIQQKLRQPNQQRSFTGVLLSEWREHISMPLLNGLTELFSVHGLDVYIEVDSPEFLVGIEGLDLPAFTGFVVRNATLLMNGDQADFFEMDKMKSLVKDFASKGCQRHPLILIWDVIDDNANLSHAVFRRAYRWCRHQGLAFYFTRQRALMNIDDVIRYGEPLSAFQWLKDQRVMNVHEKFRTADSLIAENSSTVENFLPLQDVFPLLGKTLASFWSSKLDDDASNASTLTNEGSEGHESMSTSPSTPVSTTFRDPSWNTIFKKAIDDPLSYSFNGAMYGSLGCFPIGMIASQADFDHVLQSQRQLRDLKLLNRLSMKQLRAAAEILSGYGLSNSTFLDIIPTSRKDTVNLANELARAADGLNDNYWLHLYSGLDSGFHTPTGNQFWAVWEVDPETNITSIYVSKNADDLTGVLIHTYLSILGYSRYQCFLMEYNLNQFRVKSSSPKRLPQRMAHDLGLLSPADLLLYLQQLEFSDWDRSCPLTSAIHAECQRLLIDTPTYQQVKISSNMEYIRGAVTDEDVVNGRLEWYKLYQLSVPSHHDAINLFRHIDVTFRKLLWRRNHQQLEKIVLVMETLTGARKIDSITNYVLFCIFCAVRKAAFEEIYLEISDQNPLFNQYSDQCAAFSELFALGSQCEAYFDINPIEIGVLLSEKHRLHRSQIAHQPLMRIPDAPSFTSIYDVAHSDTDPYQKSCTVPEYRRFTFLGVFAVPAFIDILLLTTTGHGLYFSAYMTSAQQKYGTIAFLCSLLLSGAIGTWVSIGGTYYLVSTAFSAANLFVLTRLIGGLAFTFAGALVGFVIIAAIDTAEAGAVFFFYLFGLTVYFSTLTVLATYRVPGTNFMVGYKFIVMVVPAHIISPLLTVWISGYDVVVYLCFIYLLVAFLVLAMRHLLAQWATWHHAIKVLSDAEIVEWVRQRRGAGYSVEPKVEATHEEIGTPELVDSALSPPSEMPSDEPDIYHGLSQPAMFARCRQQLYDAVMKEKKRRFWQKPTEDMFVKQLAQCWDRTTFLLDWYCRQTGTKRQLPYTSTWNLTTQVALENMQQSQKGIRTHNSFVHWRNAGDDIGCTVLYFLLVLMDRWIGLVHRSELVGLAAALDSKYRFSVGFGLAYYLMGAIFLDRNAQRLRTLSMKMSSATIEDTSQAWKAMADDLNTKRRLYLSTLCRYIGFYAWILATFTALSWIFNSSSAGIAMFLAYVGAYSGMLLYQYNKIFSGPHILLPLLVSAVIGFVLGTILMAVSPGFDYNGVITLAATTWTAAFLSFETAKLRPPRALDIQASISSALLGFKLFQSCAHSTYSDGTRNSLSCCMTHHLGEQKYHAYSNDHDEEFSQDELQALFSKLQTIPEEYWFQVLPSGNPGNQVVALLLSCTHEKLSKMAVDAFPMLPSTVENIIQKWKLGSIQIFLIPIQSLGGSSINLQAISQSTAESLTIYVASDSGKLDSTHMRSKRNYAIIAKTMLRAYLEGMLEMPCDQAKVAESVLAWLVADDEPFVVSEYNQNSMSSSVSHTNCPTFGMAYRRELLRNLCFGYDCDTQWDKLPLEIRQLFLRRCLGSTEPCTENERLWISANIPAENSCTVLSRIARYDLGAYLTVKSFQYFRSQTCQPNGENVYQQSVSDPQEASRLAKNHPTVSFSGILRQCITTTTAYVYHRIGIGVRFFVIAWMADADYQRELIGALRNKNPYLATPVILFLTSLWIYSRALMSVVLPFFLYHLRKGIKGFDSTVQEALVLQKKGRVIIRRHGHTETAFIRHTDKSSFELVFFRGELKEMPEQGHIRISRYDDDMRMIRREEFQDGQITSAFAYHYTTKRKQRMMRNSDKLSYRIPLSRTGLTANDESAKVYYNGKGHIESGSYVRHGNLTRFQNYYRKNARYEDELLRADIVLSHISVNVRWCAPPTRHADKPDQWIPTHSVQGATFIQDANVYECTWLYDHKFHPTISTTLNGEAVDTPDMIRHDWLNVLKKPAHCTFADENPLLEFKSPTSGFLTRLLGRNVKQQKVSVSRARSQLWQAWNERRDLDGVLTRWIDEELVRKETLLKPYWRRRDRGNFSKAEDYLTLHADAILARSDLTNDISAWTPLAIRLSDLFSFSQGGDSVRHTRTKTLQDDNDDCLHVLAVDTGTWPNEGGGVSACRRDLINNLGTIKWHMVVESANDFGLPKYQIEKNVNSLKVLPLWGIDFMHPYHGMFSNKLDCDVDQSMKKSIISDVKDNFVPILATLVRGARAIKMSSALVKQTTRALVNLNAYFAHSRHWREVWTSDVVKDTWRELWLADNIPNTQPPSEWFRTELPTLEQLDTALELWLRYLFIFSIPLPDKIPHVFQASHHGVCAAYGIVCKLKRNCTLQIWDHAISWRETNLYLSSAMCTLPPFVRNALLGLMKLTSCLVLHHADQILPCADFFNPGWETEIGSARGQISHRNVFRRKIDPVLNGITDMKKFAPMTQIQTPTPTVTMLSHVWFAKDIKTALLAADMITNQWGFKDYQLSIYGALNKSPVYAMECQQLVASKGLGEHVGLHGTADAAKVLADTWVFLNSSVSEGLPLALGEAALTGAPIVCTDVGASRRVLTDPEDGSCYSEVVAPNDADALARAQIHLLAMIGPWARFAGDDPGEKVPVLPRRPTPEDVEVLTRRMYEKSAQRRELGLRARRIVEKSFGGERYLREHEQMLWLGKAYRGMRVRSDEGGSM